MRRQTARLFEYDELGPVALKGIPGKVRVSRVLGRSGVASRFEALRSGATPLVGREEELDLLLRRWQQAKAGEGRVVLISGEPGIGKSRIAAALHERLESEQHTRIRYFCSPHHQDSALYPIIAQLERAAEFARDDNVAAKFRKLKVLLAPASPGEEELALLSELLSLPDPEIHAAVAGFSPQRKREETLEALHDQLKALARQRPVLVVFEDVH
jgi:predicted ATPase